MEEKSRTIDELELEIWCYHNYEDGLCDVCPRVQECNKYINTHGHSPIECVIIKKGDYTMNKFFSFIKVLLRVLIAAMIIIFTYILYTFIAPIKYYI